ncbi:MAG: hypothetical protein IKE90_02170 [Bacilli bacterium]|nr:hypothetical protein [Bacilli bacterium]
MKRILMILVLFLFTGCNVTYNVNIGDKIEELTNFKFEEVDYNYDNNVNMMTSSYEFISSVINEDYLAFYDNISDKLYSKERTKDGMNLSYKYDYGNIDDSSIFNYCGDTVEYYNTGKYILIKVDDFTNCFLQAGGPHLNNLTINVKSDLKVLENNADEVNGNVYTWRMSKDNFYDKKLNIKIKKGIGSNKKSTINYTFIFVVLVILIGLVIILIFYIFKKRKDNNEV